MSREDAGGCEWHLMEPVTGCSACREITRARSTGPGPVNSAPQAQLPPPGLALSQELDSAYAAWARKWSAAWTKEWSDTHGTQVPAPSVAFAAGFMAAARRPGLAELARRAAATCTECGAEIEGSPSIEMTAAGGDGATMAERRACDRDECFQAVMDEAERISDDLIDQGAEVTARPIWRGGAG
jgi:hypothetical protein